MEDSAHVVLPKRPREETQHPLEEQEPSKRHKPYAHILSLLESDEDDPSQDLSPLITTLQQEIASSASGSQSLLTPEPQNPHPPTSSTSVLEDSMNGAFKQEEQGEKEGVMRHLLEASDDELGIPNTGTGDIGLFDFGEAGFSNNGGDDDAFYSLCDGLWELEDETANYYTLLQSELFM